MALPLIVRVCVCVWMAGLRALVRTQLVAARRAGRSRAGRKAGTKYLTKPRRISSPAEASMRAQSTAIKTLTVPMDWIADSPPAEADSGINQLRAATDN
jgi:hypothetical protein